MAKKAKSVVNTTLLAQIASGAVGFISQPDAEPLLNNTPPLIGVDINQLDANQNAKVWLTEAGTSLLPNGSAAKTNLATADTPIYAVISNANLPPREHKPRGRGFGAGAPTIYPWATMDVGSTFFVPVSEKHPDPAKSMTSAVSSANMKYSEPTGEKKNVTRTKRGPGNKAVIGADGKPERETIVRDVMKPTKKFELWGKVEAGKSYGDWVAPANGVLVQRVV